MVIQLKRLLFIYIFCFIGITAIFILYYHDNTLDAKVVRNQQSIVFYKDDKNNIRGKYIEANCPVEDIFMYYTLKQNALPLGSKSYGFSSLSLTNWTHIDNNLVLYIDNPLNNELSKDFYILLYESYYALGFNSLRIVSSNIDLILNKDLILKMEVDLHRIIDLNGSVKRVYSFEDGLVKIDHLIITEEKLITYIENLYDLRFIVDEKNNMITIANNLMNDQLKKLVKLSLIDSNYSLNET